MPKGAAEVFWKYTGCQSEKNVMVRGNVSNRPSSVLTLPISCPSLSAEVQNFLLFGTLCVVHLVRNRPEE